MDKGFVKISTSLLIFSLVFLWVFIGWPQIWHNPPIPPKTELALAAIAVGDVDTASADTQNHTIIGHDVTGSNTLLIVVMSHETDAYGATGVTWDPGGVGETLTEFADFAPISGKSRVEVWYKVNPTGGTNKNVTCSSGTTHKWACAAITVTGVDQTTPLSASSTAEGNSGVPSVNVTSETNDLVMDVVALQSKQLMTVDPSQTENFTNFAVVGTYAFGSSYESGAATVTMSWSRGKADDWGIIGFNINAAAVSNNPPNEPTNVTLNDGSLITLNENTTTAITARASTTDPDGADDIDFATSTIYRSGIGVACTADDNNCYRLGSSDCVFNSATTTVTCTANIWFHADPTDASSTFSTENWLAEITVTDKGGPASNSSTTATGVELQTLWAIDITAGSPINYGTVNPNATSTNQTVTVKNTGNAAIDIELDGGDMTSGSNTIVVGRQKYATSTIDNWDSCTNCTALTINPTAFEVDLLKPTSSSTDVTDNVLWMLSVLAGTASGTYTSAIPTDFTAIGD